MKSTFSRLQAALLVCLLLSLSVAAHAQSTTGTTGNGLIYSAENGEIAITGYEGPGGDLVISGTINASGIDLPVTRIGEYAFSMCTGLTSVIIPAKVTAIDVAAFESCSSLLSAVFMGNAPAMGWSVFDGAASNFTVYFSNGVTGFSSPLWDANGGDIYPAANLGGAGTSFLQVSLVPAGAVSAGAQWQVDGGAWQNPGALLQGIAPGSHTVVFGTVSGWSQPVSQTILVSENSVATVTGTYVALPRALQVIIAPLGAIAAGGQWQVDGGEWNNSGATLSGLSEGAHTVTFKTVSGWTAPASQTVYVSDSQVTTLKRTYVGIPQALQVILAPEEAVAAGAQWQVDGGPWNNSGVTLSGLVVGSHKVAFKAVSGWAAPTSYYVSVSASTIRSATGTYVAYSIDPALSVATNTDGLSWAAGGDAPWHSQSATAHDGVAAAQSGAFAQEQKSWMETTLTGPGTLTFWWKISSEEDCDFLRLFIDGEAVASITGEVGWQQYSRTIPAGSHTLRWAYEKSGSGSGQDAAWVDQVTLEPTTVIAGLSPSHSQAGAGVVINGFNFTGATAVMFGEVAAPSFVVNSGTQITVIAPAGEAGVTANVSVSTPLGTSANTAADDFTFDFASPRVGQWFFGNFAGNPSVSGIDNGTGSAARFNQAKAVAMDTAGNLYVADSLNHTIRKVSSTGVVTLLAGSPGSSGSADGTGSEARFNNPQGVAVDAKGVVYVADCGNSTIRKITAAGVVTTLAGRAGVVGYTNGTGGTTACFNTPRGVAVDSFGSVYVADSGNNEVRKIYATGAVYTLAGSVLASGTIDGTGGAARFSAPRGIAVDSGRNVFVTDSANHTLRKITTAGVVTTLAGMPGVSGTADELRSGARFNNPAGVALDVDGNLYVADSGNHTIRKITPAGLSTTLGGTPGVTGTADGIGSAAGFNQPSGIAVSDSGSLYVADELNSRISVGVMQQSTDNSVGFEASVGVIVSGSANPHGLPATVWFEYGTSPSYGNWTPTQSIGSGTNFVKVSDTLTGLTLNAPCHYCLVFTNSEGTFFGEDRVLGPGYTINSPVINSTYVTFGATVNPNGVGGPSTNTANVLVSWQYGLQSSGSYSLTTTAVPIGKGTSPVPVSLIKSRTLLTRALYHYRLLISSTLGTLYGPEQFFSLLPPTQTVPTAEVTAGGTTLSTAVNPNGTATLVFIQYGLTPAYTTGTTTSRNIGSGVDPIVVEENLTGLAPSTAYHYRVVTTNALGTVYGADHVFATQPIYGTSAVVSTKDPAPGIPGASFSVLGNQAINDSDHAAFKAMVTGSSGSGIDASNNSGIWAGVTTTTGTLIARTGTPAPGYFPASQSVGTFASLNDPVYANDDAIAFHGTVVTAGKVSTGIWATTSGTLALVARQGDAAPDANGVSSNNSPLFAAFNQLVLPDQGGVIFLATLRSGTAGVVSGNSQGIWAVDTTGTLKLIVRKGDSLNVNGKAKTISLLAIFNAPTASAGQSRHYNSIGDLSFKATFTDGTSSIVHSVFP